jgi:hypothetical protein
MAKSQTPRASGPDKPLSGLAIRLRSADHRFETKSDKHGNYAFPDLFPGEYSVSVDLPPGYVLVGDTVSSPPKPLVISANSCGEHDLIALPTGQIAGRVVTSDGAGIGDWYIRHIRLVCAQRNKENGNEWDRWEFLKDGSFAFEHVAPGDYVVVYNYKDRVDENQPYPKTYYPSAADAAHAQQVHVRVGERVSDVVIQVRANPPSHD